MSTPYTTIRRTIAQRMDLWAGDVSSGGPAAFTSVDTNGSLSVLYDSTRPEDDNEFNGAWICINPGGTGNVNLATIWRRLSVDSGFIQTGTSAGASMTLTSPVPNSQYAAINMTYELYKVYRPEQWMNAANYALVHSFPMRHRRVSFEVPEDPSTIIYDWGRMASEAAIVDPSSITNNAPNAAAGPTCVPLAQANSTWAAGTYTVAYTFYNAQGETKLSTTAAVTLAAGQALSWGAFTIPEQALGVNYYVTRSPNAGTVFAQLNISQAFLTVPTQAAQVGVALANFQVPAVYFSNPPGLVDASPPIVNTSKLDIIDLYTLRRRINPGRFPEVYVDLSPQWWRPVGATSIKLEFRPISTYALNFECISLPLLFTQESDLTIEPIELITVGGEYYLWDMLLKTATAQNASAWQAVAKEALLRYRQEISRYAMETPRQTVRRPHITPVW